MVPFPFFHGTTSFSNEIKELFTEIEEGTKKIANLGHVSLLARSVLANEVEGRAS